MPIGRAHQMVYHWPDPQRPQQVHLDVMVDDLTVADLEVLALGARRVAGGEDVYADPAGHPFCLIRRPAWAPPVGPAG
ncbi:MAG TPA: VOC family protein [Microlunatus sp.]